MKSVRNWAKVIGFGLAIFAVVATPAVQSSAQELVPIRKSDFGDIESFESPSNAPQRSNSEIISSDINRNVPAETIQPPIGIETLPAPRLVTPEIQTQKPVFRPPLNDLQNPVTPFNPLSQMKNPLSQIKNPLTQMKNPLSKINNPLSQMKKPLTQIKERVFGGNTISQPPTHIPAMKGLERLQGFQDGLRKQLPLPRLVPGANQIRPDNQRGILQSHDPLFAQPSERPQNRIQNPENSIPNDGTELIQERFPDGKVKIQRRVIQDVSGNYVNHGAWKFFQQNGQLVANGQFKMGKRVGDWARWYFAFESETFQLDPYRTFKAPYLSKATFKDGKLIGAWLILDRNQRKISEINFKDGERHGMATWFFPNGQKMREMGFKNGNVDGIFRQWNDRNQLVQNFIFKDGRQLIRDIQYYDERTKTKKIEQNFLGGIVVQTKPDNWWDAQLASHSIEGERMLHGEFKTWFLNGQLQMSGRYDRGLPAGEFTWWHANGQKMIFGRYESGTRSDQWTWWHPNGMKSLQGNFNDNQPEGQWSWWDEKGNLSNQRVMQAEDLNESAIAADQNENKIKAKPVSTKSDE